MDIFYHIIIRIDVIFNNRSCTENHYNSFTRQHECFQHTLYKDHQPDYQYRVTFSSKRSIFRFVWR